MTRQEKIALLLIGKGADVNAKAAGSGGAQWDVTLSDEDMMARLSRRPDDLLKFLKSADGAPSDRSDTPLLIAAQQGLPEAVGALIARGADVRAENSRGETALLAAARGGHMAIVQLLVTAGADVRGKGKGNDTALILATVQDHQELVQFLLSQGADVNIPGGHYAAPPLYYAAQRGYKRIVETLLAHCANSDQTDGSGRTAAWTAMNSSHKAIVALLTAKGAKVSLAQAAYVGDVEKVSMLVQGGADLNARGPKGRTALHTALHEGYEDLARLLVSQGADVNARDDEGRTPLHEAAAVQQKGLLELLLDKGADVNAADQIGWTPLHEAAEQGQIAAVECLLAKGVDVNVKTTDDRKKAGATHYYWRLGWTPLQAAEHAARKDVMRLLIAKGAGVTIRQAAYAGAREVVARLLAEGAKINECAPGREGTLLHVAAREGNEDMVKFLLAQGADANARTPRQILGPHPSGERTPLHEAAGQGHQKVAEILIAGGADLNAKSLDSAGNTPLHLALTYGHPGLAQMLISRGANVNADNDKGERPLHRAAFVGYASLVESLLAAGAKVNVTDNDGWTPLHRAAYNGHTEVVHLLLAAGADRTLKARELPMQEAEKTALEFARAAGFADVVGLLAGEGAESSPIGAGPYRVIVTDPQAVRRFLHGEMMVDIDTAWIPQESDLAGLEQSLKAYLEKDVQVRTRTWFDRVYVLAHLRRYDREYGGFVRDGATYVVCQMHLAFDFPFPRTPRSTFSIISDGGCSVVKVVFGAQSKAVVSIDCNGM